MMGRQNVACNSLKLALSTGRVCGQTHHNGITICLHSVKEKEEDVWKVRNMEALFTLGLLVQVSMW